MKINISSNIEVAAQRALLGTAKAVKDAEVKDGYWSRPGDRRQFAKGK